MKTLYRWLLGLYPLEFRRQFGEEMECVFAEASAGVLGAGRWLFYAREVRGLVSGGFGEHIRSAGAFNLISRRFTVVTNGTRFRFPIAGITFMVISFGLVVTAIHNAQKIALYGAGKHVLDGQIYNYQPEHLSLLQTFGFAFGLTLAVTVVVWAVLHTMRRSGVHRLEDAETWPAK